jgi:hypothetical protein
MIEMKLTIREAPLTHEVIAELDDIEVGRVRWHGPTGAHKLFGFEAVTPNGIAQAQCCETALAALPSLFGPMGPVVLDRVVEFFEAQNTAEGPGKD